jgi:hypothetical protein
VRQKKIGSRQATRPEDGVPVSRLVALIGNEVEDVFRGPPNNDFALFAHQFQLPSHASWTASARRMPSISWRSVWRPNATEGNRSLIHFGQGIRS